MTDFITGCTHFGHANILTLGEGRPFSSIEEHDGALIRNWNALIRPQDTVYHLGDFCWPGSTLDDVEAYRKLLNGKIILLPGNHDAYYWGEPYREVWVNKVRCVLFHYPIEEWNGWFRGSVHFHCHTHKPDFISGERRGNVGVDATGYKPIPLLNAIGTLLHG